MDSKNLIRKLLSTCLAVTILTTYSMVALAGSEKIAGELLVTGQAINGQDPFVKINGENAQTGRSIFTGSTISTPENVTAFVNLGKSGKIELTPGTIISLSFDEKGISGDLSAGRVKVLNSVGSVIVKTTEGKTVLLNAGESIGTNGAKAQTDDDDNGSSVIAYVIILAGAAGGLIYAATRDNKISLGGATTVVSTTR